MQQPAKSLRSLVFPRLNAVTQKQALRKTIPEILFH
jgi:hypothetical protein